MGYRELPSRDKDRNNRAFVDLLGHYVVARGQRVAAVVLDGGGMRTSRAVLAALGDGVARLDVPQTDGAVVAAMRRRAPAGASVHAGASMGELLGRLAGAGSPPLQGYFDYMGAVTGDAATGSFPLEDIQAFLQGAKGRAGSSACVVLCATFAARMASGKGRRARAEEHVARDFVEPLLAFHGFVVLERRSCTYRRAAGSAPMVFVAYALLWGAAHERRGRREAEFVLRPDGSFEGYRREAA